MSEEHNAAAPLGADQAFSASVATLCVASGLSLDPILIGLLIQTLLPMLLDCLKVSTAEAARVKLSEARGFKAVLYRLHFGTQVLKAQRSLARRNTHVQLSGSQTSILYNSLLDKVSTASTEQLGSVIGSARG